MIRNFVLEGWIREKIVYYKSDEPVANPAKFYFDNHNLICFEGSQQSYPVKRWEYVDQKNNINFRVTLGYDQLGIAFSVTNREEESIDRVSLFISVIQKVIMAYQNCKKVFLEQNCSPSGAIKFDWQPNLLLTNHDYFEGLDKEQQEKLLNDLTLELEKFAANVKFLNVCEDVVNPTENHEIRAYTITELQERKKLDFNSIHVFVESVYLFINHHLFGKEFFLDDPSLSLITVAEWGLISSIILQDIHFEIEEYSTKWKNLKTDFKKASKKTLIRGLAQLNNELTEIEKQQTFVEYDLREFTNLAEKIEEGIMKNKNKKEIYYSLNYMLSLPDSLHYAKGIVKLEKLGRFTRFKRDVFELETDLRNLEAKSRSQEFSVLALVFTFLIPFASICKVYFSESLSYFADFLQILTFGVAFVILLLRFFPKK